MGLSIHERGLSTGLGPTVQTVNMGTAPQLPQPGPYPTPVLQQAAAPQLRYPMDIIPVPKAVMRVKAGDISPGCVSVPEPSLEQVTHEVRTERVGEYKMNTRPAVRRAACMRASNHKNASCKCQKNPHASSFKPLFSVGSYVLARMPRNQQGQLPNQNRMRVERALGRYEFILSDGD